MTIEIILPAYNLPDGWPEKMAANWLILNELAHSAGFSEARLTVVNDGSLRGFSAVQKVEFERLLPRARLFEYPKNRGKGHALRHGAARSEADFCLITDADFPYSMASVAAVLKKLREKGGIVVGFREPNYYEKVPFFRKMISKTLRWLLENVLRLPTSDSQCGLKAFDRRGRDVFLKTEIDRFLFDLEFLVLASKTPALEITPVAVELRENVQFSRVGLRILATEALNFLSILFR